MRAGAPQWVFYEGPPTANGPPGSHHVLSRVFKDIYPRFQTMRGHRVERKGGWDCHGLPVEIAVEQKLGITSKAEIEQYGIERFNAECRASVFTFLEDWNRLTERIGFWLDLEDAYRTLDESYIESVWWALAEIDERGLLYEGHKVVPYCPRCETTLSSHEVALGYRDVVDPSVYLKLPVQRRRGAAAGLDDDAVDAARERRPRGLARRATYARVRVGEECFLLAEARVEAVLGEGARGPRAPQRRASSSSATAPIAGRSSPPPTASRASCRSSPTTSSRPRTAPASCTSRRPSARTTTASPPPPDASRSTPPRAGSLYNPVRPDGTYDERVLQPRRRLLRGPLRQGPGARRRADRGPRASAACCCGCRTTSTPTRTAGARATPLIYYAKPSWYIATSKLRDELLAANETVAWHPPHVKHGRFGDWLANNVDWALSRERYWGTPLPVWRCAHGHVHVDRLLRRARRALGRDARRPPPPVRRRARASPAPREAGAGEACGEPMRRVPEVIDVWFDSGAMPFAQHHFPFEHEEPFERRLPGGLHLRGPGPDARLVLLAARDRHAARPRRPIATSSASG